MSDKQKSLLPLILVSSIISVSIFGGVALLSISGNTFNFFPTINPPQPVGTNNVIPHGNTSQDNSQQTNVNQPGNGRQLPGQPYTPPVVSPRSSVETNPQPAFAKYPGAVDLDAEIRRSGIGSYGYSSSTDKLDFVNYGTEALKKELKEVEKELEGRNQFTMEAKQAKVDAVKRKIDAKRAEIRQKVFFLGSETYSISDVVDNGNDSSFTMAIPPIPDTYCIIFTVPEEIAKKVVLPVQGVKVDKAVVQFFGSSVIGLRVTGSADSLNELVSNKNNYRAHVWFNNFRCRDAEHYSYQNNQSPLADVLKIEIVKVN